MTIKPLMQKLQAARANIRGENAVATLGGFLMAMDIVRQHFADQRHVPECHKLEIPDTVIRGYGTKITSLSRIAEESTKRESVDQSDDANIKKSVNTRPQWMKDTERLNGGRPIEGMAKLQNTYELARQEACADNNKPAQSYWEGALRGLTDAKGKP